jgi:lipopolysaccharide exporter
VTDPARTSIPARPLLARTIGASAWAFTGTQATAVLAFGSSIVLARLVDPGDFGRYALATAIVALLMAASSIQSGGYYIVAERASPLLLQTGLVLELCLSAALFGLLALAAFVFGLATADWSFSSLLVFAALALLLNPFADLSAAYQRDLHFRVPMLVQVGTFAVGVVVKIVLALAGLGAWALVAGDIALGTTFAVAMLLCVPAGRRLAFDGALARKQLSFGLPLLASGSMNMLIQRAPDLSIGSLLGSTSLGFYYLTSRIPAQIFQLGRGLSTALLPAYSRATDRELARGFESTARVSGFLMAIPLAVAIPLGAQFMGTVYGDRWRAGGTILWLLLAVIATRFVFYNLFTLLKSRARVKGAAALVALQLVLTVVAVAGAGAAWNLRGVAIVLLVVELALVPVRIWMAGRVVPVRVVRTFLPPLVAGTLATVLAYGISRAISPLSALVTASVAAAVVSGTGIYLTEPEAMQPLLRRLGLRRFGRVLSIASEIALTIVGSLLAVAITLKAGFAISFFLVLLAASVLFALAGPGTYAFIVVLLAPLPSIGALAGYSIPFGVDPIDVVVVVGLGVSLLRTRPVPLLRNRAVAAVITLNVALLVAAWYRTYATDGIHGVGLIVKPLVMLAAAITVVRLLPRERLARTIGTAMGVSLLILSASVVLQRAGLYHTAYQTANEASLQGKQYGGLLLFGNTAASVFAIFALPTFLILREQGRRALANWVILATLPVLSISLSRAGIAAFVAGLLMLAVVDRKRLRGLRLGVVIGAFAAAYAATAGRSQVNFILDNFHRYAGDRNAQLNGRLNIWNQVINFLDEHHSRWYVGGGMDSFRNYAAHSSLQHEFATHSTLFLMLTTGGVLMLAAFALLAVVFWRLGKRSAGAVGAGIRLAVVSGLVVGVSGDFTFFSREVTWFWILAAAATVLAREPVPETTPAPAAPQFVSLRPALAANRE